MAGTQPLAYVALILLLYSIQLFKLNYIVRFSTAKYESWNYRSKINIWFLSLEALWLSSSSMSDNVFNNIHWWKITFSSVLLPTLKNVLYFFGVQLSPVNQIYMSESSDRETQQGYSQDHSLVWTRKTRGFFFFPLFYINEHNKCKFMLELTGTVYFRQPILHFYYSDFNIHVFLRHLEGAQTLHSRIKIASKLLDIFITLEFSPQYLGQIL